MNREEKDLLLKDLCMRLPYGTMVSVDNGKYREDMKLRPYHIAAFNNWDVKPYLRHLASMTEEEKKEFESLGWRVDELDNNTPWVHNSYNVFDGVNWLVAHHFDFRGLIPMGLALEAPEWMYKTKNE